MGDLWALVEAGEIMASTAGVRLELLNAMLQRLYELGDITSGFWRHHTLPKADTPGPDRVLDPDQLQAFVDAAPQRHRGLIELLVLSLVRIGEACGLQWCDVADHGRVVTVRR